MAARMLGVHPIIPVRDVAAAMQHYRQLGFRVRSYDDGQDYAFVARGRVEFHLSRQASSWYPAGAIAVFYLDVEDADAVYAQWCEAGFADSTAAPARMPWGMHEGTHTDPDGNVIRYGSAVEQ